MRHIGKGASMRNKKEKRYQREFLSYALFQIERIPRVITCVQI